MKNVISFGVFGQKTGRAGQIILKLSTMRNQVFERKNLENENFMAVALHAQIGFRRSDQSQSSTPGQTTNGSPVLRYFLSETIQAEENGSRGTHFAKFLISNFLKGLTYSALVLNSNHEFDGFELLHLTCSQYTNKKHKKADKQVIHKEYICHFSTVPTEPLSK